MPEQSDRDALANLLGEHSWDMSDEIKVDGAWTWVLCCECGAAPPIAEGHQHIADAILASDWLADRDRRVEARALRDLPVVLAEYVRTSGQSGVSIAQEAGITTKHLSQMVNHHVGSVDAWLRVIHAIDRLNDRSDRADPDAARGERGAGK